MLHVDQSDRVKPVAGDEIWIVPCRYWEPDTYEPTRFVVDHITDEGTHFYGFSDEDGHNAYINAQDLQWCFTKEAARELQMTLSKIDDLLGMDDAGQIVRRIIAVKLRGV